MIKELEQYKEQQDIDKNIADELYEDNGYVFANGLGKPIEPRTYQDLFYRLLKKADIKNANFHCLRHYVERFVMWSLLDFPYRDKPFLLNYST